LSGDLTRDFGHTNYVNKLGVQTDVLQSTGIFMLTKRLCEYIIV